MRRSRPSTARRLAGPGVSRRQVSGPVGVVPEVGSGRQGLPGRPQDGPGRRPPADRRGRPRARRRALAQGIGWSLRMAKRRTVSAGRSATVAELVLLAAPAEARLVATRRLLDPHRLLLLLGVVRVEGLRVRGKRVGDRLGLGGDRGGQRGAERLGALDRVLGGAVLQAAGQWVRGGVFGDDLEVGDVADEVVLRSRPSSPRTCRSPRAATRRGGSC